MPFNDDFIEAAQNAILRKINNDEWERMPWLASLLEQKLKMSPMLSASLNTESNFPRTKVAIDPRHLSKLSDAAKWEVKTNAAEGALPEEEQVQQPIDCRDMTDAEVAKILEEDACGPDRSETEAPAAPRDSFESNEFAHVDGYNWRIIVTDREKNHNNSWAEHFNYRPSQEEFDHQYRHYHARTHHVHINQWVDGDWITLTPDYVPALKKENPAESFTSTEQWEEGKSWRIRYWDQRVDRVNYVYFDYKPGGITLHKYHSAKGFAVAEKRPEGV